MSRVKLKTPFFVLVLLYPGSAGLAQEDNGASFSARTSLIQFTVIAQDKDGHPVSDLNSSDLELFDSGKPQTIRIFRLNRGENEQNAQPPANPGGSDNRVFTNIGDWNSAGTSVTIIVIDALNTKWTDQAFVRQQLLRFLRGIRPGDFVALYNLGRGGFRVLYDFTTDASELVSTVNAWKGSPGHSRSALEQWLSGEDKSYMLAQGDSYTGGAAEWMVDALGHIADHLAGIPCRKNLIWISGAFPAIEWSGLAEISASTTATSDPSSLNGAYSYRAEMNEAMYRLNRAGVAVYPIDPGGLGGDGATPEASEVNPHCFNPMGCNFAVTKGEKEQVTRSVTRLDEHARLQAMDEVAAHTGGRAFYGSNDILGAIRSVYSDGDVTYTIGFYPADLKYDGKFHPLKLKLRKRRGVTLRYQTGYLDAAVAPSSAERRRSDIEVAGWSPLQGTAIPLTCRLERTGGQARIRTAIDTANLSLHQSGRSWAGSVDVAIIQRDKQGRHRDETKKTVSFELAGGADGAPVRRSVPWSADVTLQPGTASIYVIVRDVNTGNLGSVVIGL